MYDFDKIVKRRNTKCIKWDTWKKEGKPKDILPLWVADMDFETLPEVKQVLIKRAEHGIFGLNALNMQCMGIQWLAMIIMRRFVIG